MAQDPPRYQVLEPTFRVEGGDPVDALEHRLNELAADGYRLVATVPVREYEEHGPGEWVHAIVLERDPG